jgi:hypothetical protein
MPALAAASSDMLSAPCSQTGVGELTGRVTLPPSTVTCSWWAVGSHAWVCGSPGPGTSGENRVEAPRNAPMSKRSFRAGVRALFGRADPL